jgi:hypothetical protein
MTYKENSNVFLSSSGTLCPISIGGHLWGQYNPYKQMYNPYIAGNHQTLGNVTSLTPFLLEHGGAGGWTLPRTQLTTNYAFLSNYDTGFLTRYAIDDLSSDVYDPTPNWIYLFEVYSEDIVYTLEEAYIGDIYYFQLCRITFTGGTSSKEMLYQWVGDGSVDISYLYDGYEWEIDEPICLEHIKYGSNDAIVCIMGYRYVGESPTFSLIKSVIYNVNTGVAVDVDTYPFTSGLYYAVTAYYDSSPSFYKNYLIYSYTRESYEGLGTVIIDISDNTATIVDDIVSAEYIYFYFASGMVDYTNGIYYFEWMSELPPNYDSIFKLGKIDLNSIPLVSEYIKDLGGADDWTMALTVLQSDTVPYGMPQEFEGTQNIYLIPDATVVNTVDINNSLFDNFCVAIVDIPNKIVWNLTNTNLQGRDLVGSNNRDIAVNWSGGVVPFKYSQRRKVYLQILDNVALVGVSCFSYPDYQFDWYLLKETA